MARIIRARTPEEFYDTLRDAELSRAIQAVADEMKRVARPLDPMAETLGEVREYMATPKHLRGKRLRVVA